MAREGRSAESAEKQHKSLRSVNLHTAFKDRLEEFAERNAMSRSAAIDMLMGVVISGRVPTEAVRVKERVTFWVADPDRYAEFVDKVKADETTRERALEAALDAIG